MKTLEEINQIRKTKREELDLRVNLDAKTREKHILVCRGTGCTSSHSPKIIETFQRLIKEKDLKNVKYTFNYTLMKEINNNKQMKDVWTTSLTKPSEKKCGKHPTQKPLEILDRIILASTKEGDLILDPFCGSSTTGISAVGLNRRYIGIDNEKKYIELSIRRYKKMKEEQ